MGDECRDCPYQEHNAVRIEKLENDVNTFWDRLRAVEEATTRQSEKTNQIFEVLGELKSSLKNIEIAVYQRNDPFKEAVFSLGMWAVKVLVGGGALVWLAVEFGVKQ
jgi:hypothetical protein